MNSGYIFRRFCIYILCECDKVCIFYIVNQYQLVEYVDYIFFILLYRVYVVFVYYIYFYFLYVLVKKMCK